MAAQRARSNTHRPRRSPSNLRPRETEAETAARRTWPSASPRRRRRGRPWRRCPGWRPACRRRRRSRSRWGRRRCRRQGGARRWRACRGRRGAGTTTGSTRSRTTAPCSGGDRASWPPTLTSPLTLGLGFRFWLERELEIRETCDCEQCIREFPKKRIVGKKS